MKAVTKLEIPPEFDTNLIRLVKEALARAGVLKYPSMSDILPLITYMRAELRIAYNLGVEQGMIEAMAALKRDLDMNKENNDE